MVMRVVGFIIGMISIVGMFIFFLPLLGALNWINIPFAVIGFVINFVSIVNTERKGLGIDGLILCSIAIVVGIGRLKMGCGIF